MALIKRASCLSAQLVRTAYISCIRNLSDVSEVSTTERGLESQKVQVNDARIHYVKSGVGNHVLLLLPGALGSSKTDFEPQLTGFNKEKFTLISFDPRGFGQSIPPERDWPLDYFRRDADDAVGLMKRLSYKKFSVLGWSDGGIIGLILAAQYPELVHRLVVWGSNAYVAPTDVDLFKGLSNIDTWSARMREPFIKVYGEKYFRAQWKNWIEAYCRYYYERDGDICKGDLKNIKCPTFIIHGKKDPLVIEEHPNYLHENISNSRLHVIPEGKHNLHLRYAKEFNQLVQTFLDET
ncbi:hypothetical protein SNE40_007665 [Patella caerulea]|uniref:AB hydrolase-1 domain-containing protein n=1 Tax=Patella caerulea TaxID=87958 RepID=A0AAN8K507_PATCE